MHHGVEGMKWGQRRWQNEDGSLTPAGREHYGYGSDGKQSRQGKKLQKYVNSQHKIYDKYNAKREKILDKDVEKYKKKFLKDPSDKNKSKYVDALQRRIASDEIAKHMHNKIDDLTMDNFLKDKAIGTKQIFKTAALGNLSIIGLSAEAANRGAYGPIGGVHDIAKYNARMSKEEYAKISEKARDAAIKKYLEETNPGKTVNVTVLDGSKTDNQETRSRSNKSNYMNDPDNFRSGKDYDDEQKRLKSLSDADFQKEMNSVKGIKTNRNTPDNAPYWDKFSQGTSEYKKAQNEANLAEKKVYRAEDIYDAAREKYGKDSPQAEAARKKYLRAYNDFEHEYGYSPQEFD